MGSPKLVRQASSAGMRRFSEPAGEPRVTRNGQRERSARIDVDVPEFIPRF